MLAGDVRHFALERRSTVGCSRPPGKRCSLCARIRHDRAHICREDDGRGTSRSHATLRLQRAADARHRVAKRTASWLARAHLGLDCHEFPSVFSPACARDRLIGAAAARCAVPCRRGPAVELCDINMERQQPTGTGHPCNHITARLHQHSVDASPDSLDAHSHHGYPPFAPTPGRMRELRHPPWRSSNVSPSIVAALGLPGNWALYFFSKLWYKSEDRNPPLHQKCEKRRGVGGEERRGREATQEGCTAAAPLVRPQME